MAATDAADPRLSSDTARSAGPAPAATTQSAPSPSPRVSSNPGPPIGAQDELKPRSGEGADAAKVAEATPAVSSAGAPSSVSGPTPSFTDPHAHGHDHSRPTSNNFSLKDAVHDHTTLGHHTHDHHHKFQTEEVRREKEHERHVHHVQHSVLPISDTIEHERVHTDKAHPVTRIAETHGSTKQDLAAFASLGAPHKSETHDHGTQRTVVDMGETVNERVIHHVHNVVQPVLHETHRHHETIHTVIPSHHVTHEAPIIHESLTHKPISKADFLAQGGTLGSGLTHDSVKSQLLKEGNCDRSVDGVGEKLAKELGLSSGPNEHKADTRI